jgi:membrane protein required for colicin V production
MLTTADLVLLAIVGLSAVVGLWRGFVVEVMSLAVWVAAFWLAFAFGDDISALFADAVQASGARLFLGYAVTFVAALLVGGLATWLMGKLVRSTGLSGTDRILGLGFGLLRGAALGCILVLLFGFTPLPQDPWWRESRLLPGFQRGAEWLRTWLPAAVAQHVDFQPMLPALPVPSPPDPDRSDNSDAAPRSERPRAG